MDERNALNDLNYLRGKVPSRFRAVYDADELINQFWVEGWESALEAFDPERGEWRAFLTWRFRMFCFGYARKRDNHPVCHYTSRRGKRVNRVDVSTEGLEGSLAGWDDLLELLQFLVKEKKQIIVLRFRTGCTLEEVADVMEMPLKKVESLLAESLQDLRELIEEDDLLRDTYGGGK